MRETGSSFPNTARSWLLYGVFGGVFIGAGLYLLTTDDFQLVGLIGTTLSFVVAMVLVGQVMRVMIGVPDDQAKND